MSKAVGQLYKLKKENNELVSATTQLKLLASDDKRYLTDMLDFNGIIDLGKEFPSKKANRFIEWSKKDGQLIRHMNWRTF